MSAIKQPTIAFMGDLTADVYVREHTIKLGGAALNSAIWATRQGAEASILSAIGDDALGNNFVQKLQKEQIFSNSIQVKHGRTSSIEIIIEASGEREYGAWDPGVLIDYHLQSSDITALKRFDAISVTVYPQYEHIIDEFLQVKRHASMKKKPLMVVNFSNLREFHKNLDVVTQSLVMTDILVFGLDKDTDESLITTICGIVPQNKMLVMTLGKDGSFVSFDGKTFVQPAQRVKVMDTTGAGDSFLAGFLVSYLANRDIQKSLEAGTDLATRVIQEVGAY